MALITDFGVTPSDAGILHPKQRNKWKVTFIGVGGGRGTGGGGLNAQGLTVQAVTTDRPQLEFDQVQLDRYNSRAWVAGKHSWQPLNMTFEDDIGGEVTQIIQEQLEKQQALIAPGSGRVLNTARAGQDYKFAIRLDMLDGDIGVIESWAIEGCFLANVNYGDLDYSTGEAVKISLTVRYDHARQLNLGVAGNATGGPAGF
jgi:hypothetical protein